MRVALDIDFTITVLPDFFKILIKSLRESGVEIVILTSKVSELGRKIDNFEYRVNQLAKLGITDFDLLVIADGDNLEELGKSKRDICQRLNIDILFDDEDIYIEQAKKVCYVFKLIKKEKEKLDEKNSF